MNRIPLEEAAQRLAAAGIENARNEATVILADLAGISRPEVLYRDSWPEELIAAFEAALARRCRREPWQYIFGRAPFRRLDLAVTPDVLIPRPETEILVDLALKRLPLQGSCADIGTGSGAIALAVAQERPDVRVAAVDVSEQALAVARRNRDDHGLERVELFHGDLTAPLAGRQFDLITANLPYVAEAEYAELSPEVRQYEPRLALVASDAGLALVARLIREAPARLVDGGSLLLEIGCGQGDRTLQLLRAAGYSDCRLEPDLTGRIRFASGKK